MSFFHMPATLKPWCRSTLILLFITGLSPMAAAENNGLKVPAILSKGSTEPANYLPDFSFAGYANGLEDLPVAQGTVIEVNEYGAVADDGLDDTQAAQQAISAANEITGPVVVRFGPGQYRITGILKVTRSDLVLQGYGPGENGTTLWFPRPLNQVDKSDSQDELREYLRELDKRQKQPELNLDEYFTEYSWSGGFIWVQKPGTRPAPYLEKYDQPIRKLADISSGQRGNQVIEVADSSNLAVGEVLQVQWINSEGPGAGIIESLYGNATDMAGSHHWSFPNRPLVRQTSSITAIDGNRITLSSPLLHDANENIPAQLSAWDHLERVGIEDLHLAFPKSPNFGHHQEQGYNGIYLTSAWNSWVKNIRVSDADSGILSYNSANVTIRNIVTVGTRDAHYAVHMGNVHNVLAEKLRIFNPVLHSLTFNTQSTKCVYTDAEVYTRAVLDQHAGANHQNLFDQVTLFVDAENGENGPEVVVFDGSGAGYWQPGHGAYNTTWNLNLVFGSGAWSNQTVRVLGLAEGPMARIVGLHGNRQLELDYRPEPYVEAMNINLRAAPSLYQYQLDKRLNESAR